MAYAKLMTDSVYIVDSAAGPNLRLSSLSSKFIKQKLHPQPVDSTGTGSPTKAPISGGRLEQIHSIIRANSSKLETTTPGLMLQQMKKSDGHERLVCAQKLLFPLRCKPLKTSVGDFSCLPVSRTEI